jgi:hypothetical protein
MTDERWLPIPGHDGYEASDLGRVRSVDRVIVDKWGCPGKRRGRVLALDLKRNKRRNDLRQAIRLGKGGNARYVHHLVLEAFVGPRPDGMEACHENGNSLDNRLSNLRWDTHAANMADQRRHGTDGGGRRKRVTCPRRHLLAAPNLVPHLWAMSVRSCLACRDAHNAKSSAARAGRAFDFDAFADVRYAEIMELVAA